MHTLIFSFMHIAYIHFFINAYIHSFIHAYIHFFIHAYIHFFIHAYIHFFIQAHMHSFIHAYIHSIWDQRSNLTGHGDFNIMLTTSLSHLAVYFFFGKSLLWVFRICVESLIKLLAQFKFRFVEFTTIADYLWGPLSLDLCDLIGWMVE